ncbi:MAG: hypothetical protein ACHQU0_00190 [Candidatus Paceibacteria bacterium]
MMRWETFKHWNIVTATLFSVVVIFGSYLLATDYGSAQLAQASTETALLQAIATRDSNGDGLPDWEKSLYGIPMNATTTDYFKLGMTDGEAVARGLIVPKAIADIHVATSSADASSNVDPSLPPAPADSTLTAAFAQNFFTLFMAARQANGDADLSESQMNDVANQAMNTLTTSIKPASDFKSLHDLTISDSSTDSFREFAVNAEAVLLKNTSNAKKTDIDYLKDAIENNDATAFPHIASMAKMYRDSAAGLAVLPVPKELAASDLMFINTLMRESQLDDDFIQVNSDPLTAMLALQQYESVATALGKSFIDIGNIYAAAGVTLPAGTPGASFVNVISNVTAQQAKASPAAGTKSHE